MSIPKTQQQTKLSLFPIATPITPSQAAKEEAYISMSSSKHQRGISDASFTLNTKAIPVGKQTARTFFGNMLFKLT